MISKKKNIEWGILVSLVLAVVSLCYRTDVTIVLLVVLTVTLFAPRLFTPFTWGWVKLGEWLGKVTTWVVLLVLFYWLVTPIGWIRRLGGKDPFFQKRFKRETGSVFYVRERTYEGKDLERQY